ncbi:MAG: hypothetical protein J5958_02175 [Clostridia bacterium]|nr:hypothetical protein [Clostridia bacterium]
MLKMLDSAGVSCAVAVTHLDLSRMQDRAVFPARYHEAQRALKRLQKAQKSRVHLVFSYEIDYENGLFSNYDTRAYRIPGTDLLPVNFPIGNLGEDDIREFSYLIHRQHLRPLICQFERHILMPGNAKEKLLGIHAAEYLISSTSLLFRVVDDVIRQGSLDGRTFYLASNGHNATSRPPLYTPEEMRLSGVYQHALYKKLLQSNAALYQKIVR